MALSDVNDSEFNFKSPKRREAKRFDPPPWEKDAFEQLQHRKTAEEQEHVEQVDAPSKGAEVAETQTPPATGQPGEVQFEERVPQSESSTLEDRHVIEMMARLAEQEPKLQEKTWKPAVFSAMVAGALGSMLTVWGVVALFRGWSAGLTAVAAALVLIVFGIGFVAIGIWMTVRTLRQRGVL